MRPDEPKTIDPHEPIDLSNEAKVSELTEKLECSEEELAAAVEKVGDNPIAVAIFMERPSAV